MIELECVGGCYEPKTERGVSSPLVPDTYVPTGGTRHPVQNGETWANIAARHSIDPWDLIDFNFPGIKRVKLANAERAARQTNLYLREYVGCNTTTDGEKGAFASPTGNGGWRGGIIYISREAPPVPEHRCSPTGGSVRRPTFYRPLNQDEQNLDRRSMYPCLRSPENRRRHVKDVKGGATEFAACRQIRRHDDRLHHLAARVVTADLAGHR